MALKWEELAGGYGVFIGPEHGITTDTLLLAEFSMPSKGDCCADMGTGCGAIAILWCALAAPEQIYGIELDKAGAEQASASVEKNGLGGKISILNRDIRQHRDFLGHQSLDKIACNPPYKALGAGLQNRDGQRSTARHELSLTPEDLAKAAAYALKFGGSISICQRPERLTDYMTVFRANNLEPKRLRLVQQHREKQPSLFLLEARKGGKPGLRAEPTLFVEDWLGYNKIAAHSS